MAGLRPKETNSDDKDVTINNDNYKNSNYTGSEAKKTVKENVTQNTEQIMKSSPTTQTQDFITSDVTGLAIGGETDEQEKKIIEESQEDSKKEQVQSIVQTNPDYLVDELGYTPDDITDFFFDSPTEEDYYGELIEDVNGLSFIDTQASQISSTVSISGQEISNRPTALITTSEFCHPLGENGSRVTTKFGMRAIKYKNNPIKWKTHSGIDLVTTKVSTSTNPPVYAIFDGKIYIGASPNGMKGYDNNNSSSYGNYVLLYFTYKAKNFVAVYGHLKTVYLGTSISPAGYYLIKKGECIGLMGGTGGQSQNFPIHLHFEIRDLSGSKWTKFKVNYKTDTYNGEYCSNWDSRSVQQIEQGSNWLTSKDKFDSFLDPVDFLKKPDKYLSNPSTFSPYV